MQCRVGQQDKGPWTVEEQIRILEAPDPNTAFSKSIQLGKDEEHSYKNINGETVSWEFIGFEDIEDLSEDSIRDGMQLRGRFLERDDPSGIVCEKTELSIFLSSTASTS
jgi:hypothetical protein